MTPVTDFMMRDNRFKNIVFWGLSFAVVFALLAMGAVELWAVTLVEWVACILVFLWFWRMNNHRGWRFRGTLLDGPVWAFVALAVLSAVFSVYRYDSLLDLARLLAYVAVYYLAVNFFDGRRQRWFFVLLVSAGAALSLLGIGQYFFGLDHWWWNSRNLLSSTFVNHSHFAGFLEMALAVNLGLLLGLTRDDAASPFQLTKWRVLLTAAAGLMVTAFILTQSRGAWIVFALANVLLCGVMVKRKILPRWVLPVFLGGLVFFVLFIGLGEDRVAYRLQTIELGENSRFLRGRTDVWESTLKMIKDHPLTGTGIGTFSVAFPSYRPEGIYARFYYAHNDYLQMVAEMGLAVVPVFLWGIFMVLKKGFTRDPGDYRFRQMMRLSCGVGVLALMLHGTVDFNFHIPANMLVFVCLTAVIMRSKMRL